MIVWHEDVRAGLFDRHGSEGPRVNLREMWKTEQMGHCNRYGKGDRGEWRVKKDSINYWQIIFLICFLALGYFDSSWHFSGKITEREQLRIWSDTMNFLRNIGMAECLHIGKLGKVQASLLLLPLLLHKKRTIENIAENFTPNFTSQTAGSLIRFLCFKSILEGNRI